MSGSRKYPYPTHGRDFHMTPLPSGFSKNGPQTIPLPPQQIPVFSYTPWKYFYFLFKAKN